MFYDRFVKRKNNKGYVETDKAIWFHVSPFTLNDTAIISRGKSTGFLKEIRQFGVIFPTATKEYRLPHN